MEKTRDRRAERRNEMFWRIFWPLAVIVVFGGAVLFANGCGGGSSSGGDDGLKTDNSSNDQNKNNNDNPPADDIVELKITPLNATLTVGAKQTFSADSDVHWKVAEPGGGTITEVGVYTAPQTSGTYHIIATLKKDAKITKSAEVVVVSHKGSFKVVGSTLNSYDGGLGSVTALASGKILIMSNAPGSMIKAEVYDPIGNTSQNYSGYIKGFDYHTATLLPDGKVLIIGVYSVADGNYSSKIGGRVVEVFNSETGKITLLKTEVNYNLTYGHTATLLTDGTLLVVGLNMAEIYNPSDGSWKSLEWQSRRSYHTATLLPEGRVLIVGGMTSSSNGTLKLAEIYDPTTQKFSPIGNAIWSRVYHSATLLSDGRVLIAGGSSYINNAWETLKSAEIFDPNLNSGLGGFSWAGDMSTPRRMHAAIKLLGDMVLITGGVSSNDYQATVLASAEIFNPSLDSVSAFTLTGQMVNPRYGHTMIGLSNGNVLVIAGNGKSVYQSVIEVFE